MKDYLASLLRHAVTALAGLGGFLAAHSMLDPGDVVSVNAAGATLGESIAVIVSAVAARLILSATGKLFSAGAGESGPAAGGLPVFIMGAAAAGLLMTSLPSCSVAYDGTGKPTFSIDPVALAKIIDDWQETNDAKDANVKIVSTPKGQAIVATKPTGEVITEVINPSGVIVKP